MPRRPTALHGIAAVAVLLFFPDHRLSNSAFVRVDALGVAVFVLLHRIPMVRRETPHLARGAGGASSYRSVPGSSREPLGHSRRPPGSCTTPVSIERSVARHARSIRRAFDSHLPNLLRAPQATRMSLRVAKSDRHGARIGPEHADGRAPARGKPVATGKPWTVDSGEGAWHHVKVRLPCSKNVLRACAGNHGPRKHESRHR